MSGIYFALAVLVWLALSSCQMPLRSEPINWYALVAELQTHDLDASDRRFVDWMANQLAVTDVEVKPNRKQRKWLLDIKRRVDAR